MPPRSLFQQSRVLVGGSFTGYWSNDTSVYGAIARWQVYGYPSASYFVRDRIGIGLTLGGGASHQELKQVSRMTEHDFIVGPQAIFAVPLSGRFSLLFRPVLAYVREWRELTLSRPASLPPSALTSPFPFPFKDHLDIARGLLALQLALQLTPNVGISLGLEAWVDLLFGTGRGATLEQGSPYWPGPTSRVGEYWRVQVGLQFGLLLAL